MPRGGRIWVMYVLGYVIASVRRPNLARPTRFKFDSIDLELSVLHTVRTKLVQHVSSRKKNTNIFRTGSDDDDVWRLSACSMIRTTTHLNTNIHINQRHIHVIWHMVFREVVCVMIYIDEEE